MSRRIDELATINVQSTEELRLYAREADAVLGAMVTEIECRAQEINGLIMGLLKYAQAKGYSDGKNKSLRAARVTFGFTQAALAIRAARHGLRVVYPKFESLLAVELAALRREKYGKGQPVQKKLEV
ncbi:hypothetical protein [Streptosporangium roseum]|uniref:hypothetical protein n=1 Tax=Streptosporangium roseum TaxID=2001 RepID=UPI0004CDC89F|nr:hypothetical protein [Streptosporangium roseum]